ncbi:MAG: hypothetical protein JXN65_09650 [Clostridia bacterium]|nr:hypothetical protein [Clostridia bacterium]
MKNYIESGKHLANQYSEVCAMIMTITDRMAEEWEALYDLAYRAREIKQPDKTRWKSSPVESTAVLIEKMRNEMDERYCSQIAELERKRMDIEGIIEAANLNAMESRIFHLRYGLHSKRMSLEQVADTVYYSDRHVKRVLEGVFLKIGEVL